MSELPLDDTQAEFQAGPVPYRSPRRGPRNGTREPTRESVRNGEWVGRNGEVLSRRRTHVADPFQIPPELIDPDWDMQWNAVTVVGNNEVVLAMDNMMFDNGWRPVPADRPGFAKRFGTPKSGNAIIIGGLRLDERPKSMTEAAKDDEWRRANGQMRDRDAALTGGKAALRQTLEGEDLRMVGGYKGRRTGTRLGIDSEAPRPQYSLATGEE
jgi:hypothetical protein